MSKKIVKKAVKKGAASKSAPKPKAKRAGSRVGSKSKVSKSQKKNVKQKIVKLKTKILKSKTASRGKVAKPKQHAVKLQKVQQYVQSMMQTEIVEKRPVRAYPVLEGGSTERITVLLPILRDMIKRNVISDWLINLQHERSINTYVERNFTIESEATAIREDLLLTIYERFPDGMGEAQIPIISTDAAAIRAQIMEAKQTCAYTKKRAFNLPEPSDSVTLPQGHDERLRSSIFAGDPHISRGLYSQVKSTPMPADVRLNSFEILTGASTIRVMNSNGIDVTYHKTQIYVEFVLVCKIGNEEREFIMTRMAVSPEQLNIQGTLLQQAHIVRDATLAKPNPGFIGSVLFAGPSVTEFFAPHHDLNPLVLHAMAKLEFMNLSTLKRGHSIGTFIGEPITLISNPTLPLGLMTAPIDFEGNPLKPVEIIRNGVFINHIATARYAQYMNVPVTGMVSNIQIAPGATREEHLRGNDYFEIVSFSWFNPNPFSGDVSAEIRLGYHWKNGRKTPFRGGTFTGNVFRNILNARLSKEVMQSGEYYGPRVILFKDAMINKSE